MTMFSVVVPTYNRLPLLQKTVESLFRQDDVTYEIIVVDDGSTDGTSEFCKQLESGRKIRYIRQSNRGPAIARNAGIRAAQGEFIAFTDDDCIVPADWLKLFEKRLGETGAAVIGGASRTGNPENPFADANDCIVNFLKSGINRRSGGLVPFLTTNNALYRKTVLEKAGGFDKRFTIGAEDRELNYRIAAMGENLLFDPSIIVDHFNDAGFFRFLKHQYHQGRGSSLYYRIARDSTGRAPAPIPPGLYSSLLIYPFRNRKPMRAVILIILIMLAQAATAAGYCMESLQFRSVNVPGR